SHKKIALVVGCWS
ncbi:hypothetical protein D018_3070B, partial [Vibrio parahaemolyticus VP2007-007]